ncbi:MAG: NAD(P)-binding protein, partial [Acidimicrobiia bacterium]|nr:NAD(P)-binding protein [Acidimicrobiia bacterium]
MKVAIIGTGIAGLTCASLLHDRLDLTVFEAGATAGGHTVTTDVHSPNGKLAVDAGFIVYNEANYPNFTRLLRAHDVETQPSDMSFGVRCDRTGLEYAGSNLN